MTDPDMPPISVLLPTHHITNDLRLAVESVLDDLGPHDEFVVVLDGFTDSHALEKEFPDTRIRFLPHPKGGRLARALNFGLSQTTHDLVARMDGDDLSVQGRFAAQRAFMEKHPEVAVLGGQISYIDSTGASRGSLVLPAGDDIRRGLTLRNTCAHPAVMMRKSVVLAVGGYDESLGYSEDYELWLRVAVHAAVANLPSHVLRYRVHDAQMSRRDPAFSRHTRVILRRRLELANALSISKPRQALQNVLWFTAQVLRAAGKRRR